MRAVQAGLYKAESIPPGSGWLDLHAYTDARGIGMRGEVGTSLSQQWHAYLSGAGAWGWTGTADWQAMAGVRGQW